jgi:hypothetical protein
MSGNYPDFCNRYARAREAQAEFEADEILDIAASVNEDLYIEMTPNGPVAKIDGVSAKRAQLMIDTRKWRAERLNRRVFGQKVDHEHHVEPNPALDAGRVPESLAWLAGHLPGADASGGRGPDHSDVGEE